MGSLTSIPTATNIFYRKEGTLETLRRISCRKIRLRKKTRKALAQAATEMEVMQTRIYYMATEISEWRAKIGQASYSMSGPHFAKMVEDGIRNRVGSWVTILDDDFKR
jgi:hypothetical protein